MEPPVPDLKPIYCC
ncbi:unnamed protein product [Cuscuta epithymum]|uniref:Uncharacterized protein n=1 Tax=Cuscuta epithymum TaxID=186058 RepID=A0AAV0FF31_9ASTE|nr:unnamed protein product [Cuscuta epithymum]